MRERSCFIHIGTHKTGTTAIQAFLTANSASLAREGLLVPFSGRRSSNPGHHNLTSDMFGNTDFDPSRGGLAETIAEISHTNLDRVCLSSESFGLMHDRPELLLSLRERLAEIGFTARVVLYVRSQAEYLESLYAEAVKHARVPAFAPLVEEVIETGAARYGGTTMLFDYAELVSQFDAVFEGKIIVRPYSGGRDPAPIVADFLETVGLPRSSALAATSEPAFVNVRLTTGDVITRLFAVADRDRGTSVFTAAARTLVESRPIEAAERFRPLSPSDRRRFHERFSDSNARVAQAHHFDARAMTDDSAGEGGPRTIARQLFEEAEVLRSRMLGMSIL